MKKNIMMRLSALLLVAVLLTTCVISGTFAKYVTTNSAEDSARVAKWGVTVTVASSAFEKEYAATDTETEITNTVVAAVDVVAPGTSGTLATVALSGAPEVAVEVKYEATLNLEYWEVAGTYYCPLVITVGLDKFAGKDYSTADAFEAAVKAAIDAYTEEYDANTDLSSSASNAPTISWEWAFEGDDVKDTALGDAATAPTIEFELSVTVTQID